MSPRESGSLPYLLVYAGLVPFAALRPLCDASNVLLLSVLIAGTSFTQKEKVHLINDWHFKLPPTLTFPLRHLPPLFLPQPPRPLHPYLPQYSHHLTNIRIIMDVS